MLYLKLTHIHHFSIPIVGERKEMSGEKWSLSKIRGCPSGNSELQLIFEVLKLICFSSQIEVTLSFKV